MITIYVHKTQARAELDAPVTSGSVGREVQFQFSDDWNGLAKTAVFETNNYKETATVPVSGTLAIPEDVLAYSVFQLRIGVIGRSADGETVIPTVYADCGVIKQGANTTPVGTPPTPSQVEQLQAQIDELRESGVGGGATVELDTTLTQSGKAADAKAVGDALAVYVLSLSTDEADAQANSDAVTAAIAEHGHVVLRPGIYPFGSMVTIPDNTTLDLGQATIFQTAYKSTTPLFCLNGVNATLKNGFLRGTYDKNDGDEGYEFFEGEVLVRVDACENGLIENVDAGFAWGVSLAFGSLAQERGYVGSAANTSGAEHTSAALPIVEGYSYVMAYGQIGYNYIFSIAPVEYVFYDADGVALKTVTEIPRIPVGIPSGAATFTIKTICPEFLAYYYGFTNVMPMLTVRDCYFHNNHSGGFCNSTHIITVENTKFAFMGTVDNTRTKSGRSTIYGIDIEDYPTPFMRLSNCSFIKCPKSVMDGSTISQVDNCYGYDCDFGVYRGWYHIYNNLTANKFYVQGHTNEWQYPRVYLNGGKFNTAPVLHDNSGEYLFMNASEATLTGAAPNYVGGEFAPFTTYVKPNYNSSTFSFRSVLRNVALIDYSLASVGDRLASLFPKKGSEHCVWKTPYLYEKTYAAFTVAPYDIYGLTTDLPIYPGGFTFYDCVFKCRFTGFVQNSGMPDTAFVGTYENCVIDCDGGGGSLFSYGNLSGARNVNLTFKNCVINNSSVPLLFGANTWKQSFAEGSKITFINCTVSNTEANGIVGNADLTNLTVAYTSSGEGGVAIDASLTVEGAAADAKAVGNAIANVGGGGGDVWRQIADITLTEETGNVDITSDMDGKAFSLKEFYVLVESQVPTGTAFTSIKVKVNGNNSISNNAGNSDTTAIRYYYCYAKFIPNVGALCWHGVSKNLYNQSANMQQMLRPYNSLYQASGMSSLTICPNDGANMLGGVGTTIKVFGVDA